jgi:trans-aconitate methyltransferase
MGMKEKQIQWGNIDNNEYYENVSVEQFQHFAMLGGFDDGRDVDLIFPYIESSSSLVELGAGYGRVVDALHDRSYQGAITLVERSSNFFKYLVQRYQQDEVCLIHADIATLDKHDRYEVALYMWSNLSEWPKSEQPNVIKKLCSWVQPGGVLVLETIDASQKPLNSSSYENQGYCFDSQYGKVHGYNASVEEVDHYAKEVGLVLVERIAYTTETSRKRFLHVFRLSH